MLVVLFCPRWAAPGGYTFQRTVSALGGECTRTPRTYLGAMQSRGVVTTTCLVEACLCIVVSGGWLSGSFVGWWSFGLGGFSLAGFYFDVDEISTP